MALCQFARLCVFTQPGRANIPLMSIVLIQRNGSSQAIEKVLGVYSSWHTAWVAFYQRWKKGGFPYSGGIFKHNNIETFDYMVTEMKPGTTTILLFSNDHVVVSATLFSDDGPVK